MTRSICFLMMLLALFVASNSTGLANAQSMMVDPNAKVDQSLSELELRYGGQTNRLASTQQRLNRLETQTLAGQKHFPKDASVQYRVEQLYAMNQAIVSQQAQQQAIAAYNQGVDAANARQWQQAIDAYEEALKHNPGMLEAANNLGVIFENQNQLNYAAEVYQNAIDAAPVEPILHRNLGVVYERLGDVDSALSEFQVYLALTDKPDPPIQSIVENFQRNKQMASHDPDYVGVATEASDGYRAIWPNHMIPIRIYTEIMSPDQIAFLPLVEESWEAWEKATKKWLKFKEVDSPFKAHIILTFKQGPVRDAVQDVGHADYRLSRYDNGIVKAMKVKIRVNTGLPNDGIGSNQRQELIRRHILHELGHAVGIWGHSNNPDDVMYTHPMVSELSHRDVRTVQKLYELIR